MTDCWLTIETPTGVCYTACHDTDTAADVVQRAVGVCGLAEGGWRLYWEGRLLDPDKPIPRSLAHPEVRLTLSGGIPVVRRLGEARRFA